MTGCVLDHRAITITDATIPVRRCPGRPPPRLSRYGAPMQQRMGKPVSWMGLGPMSGPGSLQATQELGIVVGRQVRFRFAAGTRPGPSQRKP